MDLKRIFVKDACPTKVGGQAVLDRDHDEGGGPNSSCRALSQ